MRRARRFVFAVTLVSAALVSDDAAALDRLAPYRALRHTPAGDHLLEIARDVMSGADGATAPGDAAVPVKLETFPAPPPALIVTLRNGPVTRACVGQEPPASGDLAEAVRRLAAEARTGDRRRPPVRAEELESLSVVIGFADVGIPLKHVSELDPGREGLLIETDRGRVAFLPGEARTVSWAMREARRIGVLAGAESNARVYRFDVVTLSEPARLPVRRKEPQANAEDP
jgi:AMMECR1 domain-containing protein